MAFRELISSTLPGRFDVRDGFCNFRIITKGIIFVMPFMPCGEQGIDEYFRAIDLLFSDDADEDATLIFTSIVPAELLRGLNINCEITLRTELFSELQCKKLIIDPVCLIDNYEFINTYELEISRVHLYRIIIGSNIVAGCKIVNVNGESSYANNKTSLAFRQAFPNAVIIYFKSCLKLNRVTINKINSLISLGFIVAYNRYNNANENITFIPLFCSIKADFIHDRSENYFVSYGAAHDIMNTFVAMNYSYDNALIKNANK